MKLPSVELAVIDNEKLVGYLLHPEGKGGFFLRFGFDIEHAYLLRQVLLFHAHEFEVAKVVKAEHGVKYVIEGVLSTPDERNPIVRAVWIIEYGTNYPRLVTAYPL